MTLPAATSAATFAPAPRCVFLGVALALTTACGSGARSPASTLGSGDAGDGTGGITGGSGSASSATAATGGPGSETGPTDGGGDTDDSGSGESSGTTGAIAGSCGDAFVDPGEMCDDGNDVDGDGCDSDCTAPEGTVIWAIVDAEPAGTQRVGNDVAVDSAGHVYVAGDVRYDGQGFGYLGKYSAAGELLWEGEYGDPQDFTTAHTVSVGPDDRPVVAGSQSVAGSYGGAWVAKYSADGDIEWSQQHTDTTLDSDRWHGSAIDSDGAIVLCGQAASAPFASDIWVRKLDAQGQPLWTREIGIAGNAGANARACAIATNGDVIAVGHSASSMDPWMARLDADGQDLWTQFEQPDFAGGSFNGVAVDAEGGPYITGQYIQNGNSHIPIRRHDSGGAVVWTETYATSSFSQPGNDIALHPDGSLTVAGTVHDPGVPDDGFVGRYSEHGEELWVEVFDDVDGRFDRWKGVAVDPASNAFYVVGDESDNGSATTLWLRKYAP